MKFEWRVYCYKYEQPAKLEVVPRQSSCLIESGVANIRVKVENKKEITIYIYIYIYIYI